MKKPLLGAERSRLDSCERNVVTAIKLLMARQLSRVPASRVQKTDGRNEVFPNFSIINQYINSIFSDMFDVRKNHPERSVFVSL